MKAIDGFDPERGRPFVAYATPTILGELRRHFRDHVWTVRLPRGLGETTMRVDGAITELSEELGRYPAPAEIAERLEITIEDVLEALEAGHARRTVSLDAPRIGDEESTATVETIGTSEAGYDRVEAQLASEAAELDEREWEVLRMRFVEDLSQHEIGSAARRLADAGLADQPQGAVEAAQRRPGRRRERGARSALDRPPSKPG